MRDDYTCQICKQRGGVLNADHYPIPFSKLFEEFQKAGGAADDFAPFWDINNGRTLCVSCHKATPTYLVSGHRLKAALGIDIEEV
mgnify:CR=1 FL=1